MSGGMFVGGIQGRAPDVSSITTRLQQNWDTARNTVNATFAQLLAEEGLAGLASADPASADLFMKLNGLPGTFNPETAAQTLQQMYNQGQREAFIQMATQAPQTPQVSQVPQSQPLQAPAIQSNQQVLPQPQTPTQQVQRSFSGAGVAQQTPQAQPRTEADSRIERDLARLEAQHGLIDLKAEYDKVRASDPGIAASYPNTPAGFAAWLSANSVVGLTEGTVPADSPYILKVFDPSVQTTPYTELVGSGSGARVATATPTAQQAPVPTDPLAGQKLAEFKTNEDVDKYVQQMRSYQGYDQVMTQVAERAKALIAGGQSASAAAAAAVNELVPGMSGLSRMALSRVESDPQARDRLYTDALTTLRGSGNQFLKQIADDVGGNIGFLRQQLIQDAISKATGAGLVTTQDMYGNVTGQATFVEAIPATTVAKVEQIAPGLAQELNVVAQPDATSEDLVQARRRYDQFLSQATQDMIRRDRGTAGLRSAAQNVQQSIFQFVQQNYDDPQFETLLDTAFPLLRENTTKLRTAKSQLAGMDIQNRIAEETSRGLIDSLNSINAEKKSISDDQLNKMMLLAQIAAVLAQKDAALAAAFNQQGGLTSDETVKLLNAFREVAAQTGDKQLTEGLLTLTSSLLSQTAQGTTGANVQPYQYQMVGPGGVLGIQAVPATGGGTVAPGGFDADAALQKMMRGGQ